MPLPPTEAEFLLPFGYFDKASGRTHRVGLMRLPTQKDLTIAIKLAGEVNNPAYLETLLLSRIVVQLGDILLTDSNRQDIIEALPLPDVDHLNLVYQRLTQGQKREDLVCPQCGHRWRDDRAMSEKSETPRDPATTD